MTIFEPAISPQQKIKSLKKKETLSL